MLIHSQLMAAEPISERRATGGDAEKLAGLQPGSKEFVDVAGYDAMRAFRQPVLDTHLYVFYVLAALKVLHIAGAVLAEIRHRNGLISAMFTGEKILSNPPVDAEKEQ